MSFANNTNQDQTTYLQSALQKLWLEWMDTMVDLSLLSADIWKHMLWYSDLKQWYKTMILTGWSFSLAGERENYELELFNLESVTGCNINSCVWYMIFREPALKISLIEWQFYSPFNPLWSCWVGIQNMNIDLLALFRHHLAITERLLKATLN